MTDQTSEDLEKLISNLEQKVKSQQQELDMQLDSIRELEFEKVQLKGEQKLKQKFESELSQSQE